MYFRTMGVVTRTNSWPLFGPTKKTSNSPDGASTRLSYTASATVGGKLAQVGSRLIDGIARKMAEEFFSRFNQTVGAQQAVLAEPAAVQPATEVPAAPPAVSKWLWRWQASPST